MGGRSLDKTSSQAMYRALDTAPFRARGKLLQEGSEGERDVQISPSEDKDIHVIMRDTSSSFNTRSSEQTGLSTAIRLAFSLADCVLKVQKVAYMTMRLAVLECSFSSSLRRICRLVCTRTQRGT